MNGKKVLNGLIKLFLVLNLALFTFNYVSKSNEYLLSQERLTNISQLLEREGIQVDGEFVRDFSPKKQANLLYKGDSLSTRDDIVKKFFDSDLASVKRSKADSMQHPGEEVKYYALNGETLIFDKYELGYKNDNVGISGPKLSLDEAKRLCVNLMNRIGIQSNTLGYVVESLAYDEYWQITYYYKLEDLPVLDLYMSFNVYREGIAQATMYLGEIEISNEEGQDIYPVDLVLFGLEDELLKNHYTWIKKVSMAYKRLENEDSIWGQQIIPVYKIEVDGLDEAIFVNAYTNKVLQYND